MGLFNKDEDIIVRTETPYWERLISDAGKYKYHVVKSANHWDESVDLYNSLTGPPTAYAKVLFGAFYVMMFLTMLVSSPRVYYPYPIESIIDDDKRIVDKRQDDFLHYSILVYSESDYRRVDFYEPKWIDVSEEDYNKCEINGEY